MGWQFGLDVIFKPFTVPPLHRVNMNAVEHCTEVEVVPTGKAGVPGTGHETSARQVV
ncbi:MAG: hypothetical protein HYZ72_05485, partial [Deltaproteobacteria bacterium]|nr:hypothetical protein [Deltaproteobacteria bacterium]